MDILFALIPSILWGTYSLVIPKFGGNTGQQTLGVTLGALLFAIITFPFTPHNYTGLNFTVSFVSGIVWAIGCLYQMKAFKSVGVSRTIPITTGMQLVGTSLMGVLFFGEWGTATALAIGISALVLLIIGITFTAYSEASEESSNLSKGIIIILISSVAIIANVMLIRFFNINSFDAILPQSLGMVCGALLITMKDENRFSKKTTQLMIPGLLWALGNLIMLYSNNNFGVAVGFSLSQLGLVISTIGGIVLLGEEKTVKEKRSIIIGLAFVFAGVICIGISKSF
ncbi:MULTISPECIES: GRP family sugar transporter [unclassified Enterococcus]|uniref:GRP family sugar transporter n=1 Tax=unclassified Enterococcus TaxID=2608891 RepID=UPI00155771C6|nr:MULTISPECIES: GRP family sugar transporter [unclassified Enterococcus]MBS7576895.1 glucose transporter GlcU [Enterococcus sp. MMGLQ5-2]MBS7584302.1 glucose transporter GlcU [Enterococcus sp. MMGLQ5-1]NPD12158.1 glucose transporter GlcU [Enterococcus sp. MMGLQ5-1]NPD36730.1 glucose transporter GlcU [Enterococcus sp. MMGLQ5-2]